MKILNAMIKMFFLFLLKNTIKNIYLGLLNEQSLEDFLKVFLKSETNKDISVSVELN